MNNLNRSAAAYAQTAVCAGFPREKLKILATSKAKDSLHGAIIAVMALIETERTKPKIAEKDTALRDWVRALEATAPIASQSPTPAHPHHRGRGANTRRRPGASFSRRKFQLRQACRSRQPLLALGARPGARERRHRLSDDAEPAGIHGDLARPFRRRRDCCAHQHAASRAFARLLHRHRVGEACYSRRGIHGRTSRRSGASGDPAENLGRTATAAMGSSASTVQSSGFRERRSHRTSAAR